MEMWNWLKEFFQPIIYDLGSELRTHITDMSVTVIRERQRNQRKQLEKEYRRIEYEEKLLMDQKRIRMKRKRYILDSFGGEENVVWMEEVPGGQLILTFGDFSKVKYLDLKKFFRVEIDEKRGRVRLGEHRVAIQASSVRTNILECK